MDLALLLGFSSQAGRGLCDKRTMMTLAPCTLRASVSASMLKRMARGISYSTSRLLWQTCSRCRLTGSVETQAQSHRGVQVYHHDHRAQTLVQTAGLRQVVDCLCIKVSLDAQPRRMSTSDSRTNRDLEFPIAQSPLHAEARVDDAASHTARYTAKDRRQYHGPGSPP